MVKVKVEDKKSGKILIALVALLVVGFLIYLGAKQINSNSGGDAPKSSFTITPGEKFELVSEANGTEGTTRYTYEDTRSKQPLSIIYNGKFSDLKTKTAESTGNTVEDANDYLEESLTSTYSGSDVLDYSSSVRLFAEDALIVSRRFNQKVVENGEAVYQRVIVRELMVEEEDQAYIFVYESTEDLEDSDYHLELEVEIDNIAKQFYYTNILAERQ